MDGFKINTKGDIVIENGEIAMVSDNGLIEQTVKQVLRTNLGEWWLNEDEGIDFYCILSKNPDFDEIRDNVNLALRQVDETFSITDFNCSIDKNRKLTITFTAENDSEEINITL